MFKAVILAGGSGKRLWPLSRDTMPKQCLSLVSDKSLLEDAVERMEWVTEKENISLVTTRDLELPLKKLVPDVTYLLEPVRKGTAASICLVALHEKGNHTMVIGTADHAIKDPELFAHDVKQACALAESGSIVLFGIPTTRPETGYGYIKKGMPLPTHLVEAHTVAEFKEKPSLAVAEDYVATGQYLWNSGMFIAKRNVLLDAIQTYMPSLWHAFSQKKVDYSQLASVSIDVGVIEKSKNVSVVKATFSWDDVGDFRALTRLVKSDAEGNVIHAPYQGNTKNSLLWGSERVICVHDISDIVVVDTYDVVLVCTKGETHSIGRLCENLEKNPLYLPYTQQRSAPPEHVIYDEGQNKITTSCGFVATWGVKGVEIMVNAQSVIIHGNR